MGRLAWRGAARAWWLGVVVLVGCGGDPEEPDASIDDAGMQADAAPECSAAEDCADGFFCNGEERCNEGRCEAGPAPRCDDGIDCTLDRCDEVARACRSSAPDRDGDGFFDASCRDGEGVALGRDCDDEDDNRFPGNTEQCDAEDHDEDCDPMTFGAVDNDGDGEFADRCCNVSDDGTRTCGVDCDDTRAGVNNTVPEVCNGLDDDCDGMVDEEVLVPGFVDADFDGQGDSSRPVEGCGPRPGVAETGGDCDDTNPSIRDGGPELCDLLDNDCDGETDESPTDVDWYRDLDSDGFGSAASGVIRSCAPQSGHSLLDLDCDDDNGGVNPGQSELCNGIDDDCFGGADFEIGVNDFEDDDGDGLVDLECGGPAAVDCDDADPSTGGGAEEICDGRDNDCDERVDEGATDALFFRDADGDGWGSETSGVLVACRGTEGFVSRGGDCDDGNPDISPDGVETCDGIDEDCNGAVDDGTAVSSCDLDNTERVACDSGECQVRRCAAGFGDCDGNSGNGCEAVVDADTSCGCAARDCGSFPSSTGTCEREPGGDEYLCALTCEPDRADCDFIVDNGCETDLLRSPVNCGTCGEVCEGAGAARGICVAGACLIECEPGFGDCDLDPLNGCEADLTQPGSCGECTNVCTDAVGMMGVDTVACAPDFFGRYACQVASCTGSFDDCNHDFADGCETDTLDSEDNCGGCGFRCLDPDSQCSGGACQTVCMGTQQDCDMMASNGCETDTLFDQLHCGGCNSPCPMNLQCNNALCCGFDQANCDGDSGTGCEVDLRTDNTNCGFCGNVCAAGSVCINSTCQLDCLAGTADCNPDVAGCETTLGTDTNCGFCADTCGAGTTCTGSVCECTAPLANCDGFPGCETDTSDDEMNCGGCDFRCFGGDVCSMGGCTGPQQVVTGSDFSCALMADTTVWCWGSDSEGQLGLGAPDQSTTTPAPIPGFSGALMLSAGSQHVCALRADGTVWCWGANGAGQVGCGAGTCPSPVQTSYPDPSAATYVDVEGSRTCVITRGMTDRIYCWGDASIPESIDISMLPAPPRKLALGSDFGCVATDFDDVLCWGGNAHGQLGDGGFTTRSRPEVVVTLPAPAREMAAGEQHFCVTTNGDELYCWGAGSTGENGQAGDVSTPTRVSGGYVRALAVGTSARGTCITRGGLDDAACMGSDASEELGDGSGMTPSTSLQTVMLPAGVQLRALSGGPDANSVCALGFDNRVYCWGDNSDGQLGAPSGTVFDAAVEVLFP